jgi:hypothetical protein
LFEDMFRDYTPDELAVIKAKYATEGDVLEVPMLIEKKARDMLRHYVGVVLPEGFKAQVVATSRQAAVTYYEKLEQARRELVADLVAEGVENEQVVAVLDEMGFDVGQGYHWSRPLPPGELRLWVAELYRSGTPCGGRTSRGSLPRDTAHRGSLPELRRASRARVRRWPAADRPALVQQRGVAQVHSGVVHGLAEGYFCCAALLLTNWLWLGASAATMRPMGPML